MLKNFLTGVTLLSSALSFGADLITFDEATNSLLGIVDRSQRPDFYVMNDFLPNNFFSKLEAQKKIQFFPVFADRASWEKAKNSSHAKHIATEIIRNADEFLADAPIELTEEDFQRFIIDGNRTIYQDKYFSRRKILSYFVLACCLSGNKEKYMPQIINYIQAILAEESWCIPAHCIWNGKVVSKYKQCDLFAGDTAAMLALTVNILGEELDKEIPEFSQKINKTVIERTFGNLLDSNTHSLNYWYHAERSWNWISWCSSNCLLSALLAAPTPELRAQYVQMMLYPMSRYYNSCDDDGFTPEGASYFPVAAGMLFNSLEYLENSVPGSTDKIYAENKIRRMMSFISEIGIGKNMITYSDSSPKSRPDHLLTAQIAKRLNSSEMAELLNGTELEMDNTHRLLLNSLRAFFNYPDKLSNIKSDSKHSTLFRNRLAILRTDGFSASLKAGNNDEPHNHNDLGHFTVYYKEKPIIIDVGTGPYSAIDFSDKRYTLWYTRGNGHNAPVINGIEQENNIKHFATITEITENNGVLETVCDLGKGYPGSVGILNFYRTLRCAENFAEICDNLQTDGDAEIEISLFTLEKVQVEDNIITLGEVKLILDNLTFVKSELEQEKFGGWDTPIYRITLKGKNGKYSIKFCE